MAEKRPSWIDKQLAEARFNYTQLTTKPSFEIGEAEEIMLKMSDEAALRTVCRKPTGNGPFPTIVMRTCYPHQELILNLHAEEYAHRGFAFVYQYCRGTGGSEGEWVPNIHDRQDGKETLDWLDAQTWVESIGFWGSSYLAFTGWIVADIIPGKVKTLYLTHYGTDRFASAYQNGLFRQDILTAWAMGNAGRTISADYQESLKFRPHIKVDEKLWGGRIDWYRDWITNTSRCDAYWNSGFWKELQDIPSKIKVPVYLGEGWYDHHLGSALRGWETLNPAIKQHSMLRVGAWNHGFMPCVEGTAAVHLENNDVLSAFTWFDTILHRQELPAGCVRTYRIGADRWEDSPAYPFPQATLMTYYLSSERRDDHAFLLSATPGPAETPIQYTYNPDNPVPSHGAESLFATFREVGSLPQPPCSCRDDVISFVSEELDQDIDILGIIKVVLQVASTADDTAFTAKLMEIRTDGQAYNIRSGITTMAYRQDADQPRMTYEAGQTVEAVIDLWDISWRLAAGSYLRLDVSSSDFPQYAAHTNYAGIWSLQAESRSAVQTIRTGEGYHSRIILPVR